MASREVRRILIDAYPARAVILTHCLRDSISGSFAMFATIRRLVPCEHLRLSGLVRIPTEVRVGDRLPGRPGLGDSGFTASPESAIF